MGGPCQQGPWALHLEHLAGQPWAQVSGGWLANRLPTTQVWLANGELPPATDPRGVAREGNAWLEVALPSSLSSTTNEARRTRWARS